MNELSTLLARQCHGEHTATAIPRLDLYRADSTSGLCYNIYQPVICFVAQGRKRVFLGEGGFEYYPMSYLVAPTHLPVAAHVIEAPYLALALTLDLTLLGSLLLEMPRSPSPVDAMKGFAVTMLGDELLDTVLRLVRLLDHPADIPVLAPLAEKEIIFRLLGGPSGEILRQLAFPASELFRISGAIQHIRTHYDEVIRVDELAGIAAMSVPSFHRHFKAVTSLSPLQFQKQIRLQEARRLLLLRNEDAASVAFRVGYESPSQFSREYRRMFGAPPTLDRERERQAMV
jgi:AraC-like DNA-binding protein